MNCPHCQTLNPGEAKFCMNCGKPLNIACSQCGKENPPQAKFCIDCGYELSSLVKPQQDPVHRFIPKAYAEKLEVARKSQTMKGERRIVTIEPGLRLSDRPDLSIRGNIGPLDG